MRYVETARLRPTGLGKEGDLLLAASRSLQALALPVHWWPTAETEREVWSPRTWRPRAVPPYARRLERDAVTRDGRRSARSARLQAQQQHPAVLDERTSDVASRVKVSPLVGPMRALPRRRPVRRRGWKPCLGHRSCFAPGAGCSMRPVAASKTPGAAQGEAGGARSAGPLHLAACATDCYISNCSANYMCMTVRRA
jgi:hypothetical protein